MDDHLPYTRPIVDIVYVDHAIDTSWGRGKHKGAGRRMRLGFHRATHRLPGISKPGFVPA